MLKGENGEIVVPLSLDAQPIRPTEKVTVPIKNGIRQWLPRGIILALHSSLNFLRHMTASARGAWYACLFPLLGRNVRIHLPFYAHAHVHISGKGRVEIGSGCEVFANTYVGLSIVTLSPQAEVMIGRNATVGGLVIRSRRKVVFGDRVRTSYCLIQDDLFVHPDPVRIAKSVAGSDEGVVVGTNTWVALNACILAGTHIGSGAVVAAGSVILGRCVPEGHLALGNPNHSSMPIQTLLHLRG